MAHKTKGATFCGAVAGVANAKDEWGPRVILACSRSCACGAAAACPTSCPSPRLRAKRLEQGRPLSDERLRSNAEGRRRQLARRRGPPAASAGEPPIV